MTARFIQFSKQFTGNIFRWLTLHPAATLSLLVVVVLLPFLGKPFNMDDPLFLRAARHIQEHPLDPYGFPVNWFGTETPMWEATKNPPLACYYLAGAASLFGWSEVALHAAFLLPALAAVLGTWRLAQQLCRRPFLAAAVTFFTPAFLISSTTVMCDVLMLAFWVWAIYFWREGLRRDRQLSLWGAGLLAALALLTKYYGACLVPLLAAVGLLARRRGGWWTMPLLVPVTALVLYHLATLALYHHSLPADAADYARFPETLSAFWVSKSGSSLSALTFLGGCLATATFFMPLLWRARQLALCAGAAGLLAVGLLFASAVLKEYGPIQGSSRAFIGLQLVFWAGGGACILALTVADAWNRHEPESWLLALWVFGTFAFAALFNWTVNGRTLLPLAPAVGILVARRLDWNASLAAKGAGRGILICLATGAALSLLVARADYLFAKAVRQSALTTFAKFGTGPNFRFQGHWGFQYYLEAAGAAALDINHTLLQRGDVIATPENNTNFSPLGPDLVVLRELILVPGPRWLTTMKGEVGAGFYAALRGPLPFALGLVPPDRVVVCVVDPLTPSTRPDPSNP
jgi:4-amino-4-deoxy-L-arabinose transferase-like glycosyltransferase